MNSYDIHFSRGFSRPVFRLDLVPAFVAALRAMGLPDWVLVREKLYSHLADQVIELLLAYKDAFVARELAEKVWYVMKKPYPLDEPSQLALALVSDSKRNERVAYEALCQLLAQPTMIDYKQHEQDWNLAVTLM